MRDTILFTCNVHRSNFSVALNGSLDGVVASRGPALTLGDVLGVECDVVFVSVFAHFTLADVAYVADVPVDVLHVCLIEVNHVLLNILLGGAFLTIEIG